MHLRAYSLGIWVTPYLRPKCDALPVEADRVIEMSFPVFHHVGDITVGDRSVGPTSGLAFPVRENLNRWSCSGVLFVSAYVRFGDLSKIGKKLFLEVTFAISEPLQLGGCHFGW